MGGTLEARLLEHANPAKTFLKFLSVSSSGSFHAHSAVPSSIPTGSMAMQYDGRWSSRNLELGIILYVLVLEIISDRADKISLLLC
jgi:hypothetical protein